MKRYLIVFAKEPEIGKVKTRLSTHLSKTDCIKLYKAFLKYTIELARNIKCNQRIVAYDSGDRSPDYLKKIATDFKFCKQEGKNLGERMYNAFVYAKDKKAEKTIIIGSDSPNLPSGIIKNAFQKLDRYDLVLGPAYDGGYYLIGLKEPYKKIFEGIKWSSNTVFARTLKKAKKLKKKIAVLDFWYDIDMPKDLQYLEGKENPL